MRGNMSEDITHELAERTLLYIWSECVLDTISVTTYKEIKKKFEKRINELLK